MAGNPSIEEIIEAVASSGYLMEQHVASTLEGLGFHVTTNYAFEDPDQGKSREMDVRAIKRVAHNEDAKLSAFVELIVECKNSSNPFVFIARPKNATDQHSSPKEFTYPHRYEMRQDLGGGRAKTRTIAPFFHLGFDQVYAEQLTAWKAVQFCRIDRKGGGWHANHGGLYDSIFYPMAKAVTARLAEIPRPSRHDEWRYFHFLFPLVVTSGELMLIDSAEAPIIPRPIDSVGFTRELKSGKLSGKFALQFVRQEQLEPFMANTVGPVVELLADLVNDRSETVAKTTLPWID